MQKRNSKAEFVALSTFLVGLVMMLTNGFSGVILAQDNEVDVYQKIDPIGDVLAKIQDEYVLDADLDKVVEGALIGMMSSLDRHSSFISATDLEMMREETKGEFFGIGVSINVDEEKNVYVFSPIEGSPAALAGLQAGDIIIAIDDLSAQGMTTADVADKIRGPKGTTVKITVLRKKEGAEIPEKLDFTVKRDKVPIESIKEARLLDNGIGYIRISDFKESTSRDLRKRLTEFLDKGMKGFVLDLRWNPGGLLNASKDVSELFLPKGSLVTYTKGRQRPDGRANMEDMKLYTESNPVLPPGLPVVLLVNESTASSSEIVTGALQYYQRALIVGEKTFGKGSVQTIIPLNSPRDTALRLTTALYYTPADVTINHQGILPDVPVEMADEQEAGLFLQMRDSALENPANLNAQNHGGITGNEVTDTTVDDTQLRRAIEMLQEDAVWENLIKKYHRDVHETQMAAESAEELSTDQRRAIIEAQVTNLDEADELKKQVENGNDEPAISQPDATQEPDKVEAPEPNAAPAEVLEPANP